MVCKLKTVYTVGSCERKISSRARGVVTIVNVFVISGIVLVHLYRFCTCLCAEMGHVADSAVIFRFNMKEMTERLYKLRR